MVGFGSLGSLAQSAVKNFSGDDTKKDTKESQAESADSQWADVGASAKKAFTDYQDSQKKGEKANYSEIGEVAMQAQKAYSSSDGPKDATAIGKAVASGFLGHDKPEAEKRSVEPGRGDQPDNERRSDNESGSKTESRPSGGNGGGRDFDERKPMHEQWSTGNDVENRSESGNYSGDAGFGRDPDNASYSRDSGNDSYGRDSGNASYGRDSGNPSSGRDSGVRDEIRPMEGDNVVGQGGFSSSSGHRNESRPAGNEYGTQDEGFGGNSGEGNGSSRRY